MLHPEGNSIPSFNFVCHNSSSHILFVILTLWLWFSSRQLIFYNTICIVIHLFHCLLSHHLYCVDKNNTLFKNVGF